jgi:hypothetical protein
MQVQRNFNDKVIFQSLYFEYGIQLSPKNLFYIRFYDLVTIDIDKPLTKCEIQSALSSVSLLQDKTWWFLRTTRGVHLFLMNYHIPFNADSCIKMTNIVPGSDTMYNMNSCFQAFKVRVSSKFDGEILPVNMQSLTDQPIKDIHRQSVNIMCMLKQHHNHNHNPFPFHVPPSFFNQSYLPIVLQSQYSNDADFMSEINNIDDDARPSGWSNKRYALYKLRNGTIHMEENNARKLIIESMRRPQRLLKSNDDYYIANDLFTRTTYACFKSMLMIDIDQPNMSVDMLSDIIPDNSAWVIHKTRRGFHVFAVDKTYDYESCNALEIMTRFGCDAGYVRYCRIRGWSVRLSPKLGEVTPYYHFVKIIAKGVQQILPELLRNTENILRWSNLEATTCMAN